MVRIDADVLVGWSVFTSVYILLWNSNIAHMIHQGNTALDVARLNRGSVFILGAYTVCRVTLLLILYFLLLFCLMSMIQCILPFLVHMHAFHHTLRWIFAEEVLFRSFSPSLLPFHATVFAAGLALPIIYSTVRVSDDDLTDSHKSHSIIVQEALAMAALGSVAYLGIGFFNSMIRES